MNNSFQWKIFFILWIASIIGVIAVIPYSLALLSGMLQDLELPLPLPTLLVLQVVQSALLFSVLIALGLLLANRLGLGLPILEARLRGESVVDKIRTILPVSVIVGV